MISTTAKQAHLFGWQVVDEVQAFATALTQADQRDPLGEDMTKQPLTFVTPEVNKKIREQLLKQNWLTNRFHGSQEAAYAEREFLAFRSRYELRNVRRRLAVASLCTLVTIIDPLLSDTPDLAERLIFITAVPMVLLATASALCFPRRTRPWWRIWVVCAALGSYNSMLWGRALLSNLSEWSTERANYEMGVQLVLLLVAVQLSALVFALDFVHVFVVLLSQTACFITCMVTWWRRRNVEGRDGRDALVDALTSSNQSAADRVLQSLRDESGLWILLECTLIASCATVLLLAIVRRLNRFERQSFVNSFVLLNKTVTQEKKKHDERRELLALFSNPNAPQQLQLKPLQLGQELKFLLRSIPTTHLACEPAASLEDVEAAVNRCNPSLVLFSGHSFVGSLAFELPNGRIDLPPADLFIAKLANCPRLHCCFLNGCNTGVLGHQIVSRLPHIKVICWSTVAEDAAARSFALGFYDAVRA